MPQELVVANAVAGAGDDAGRRWRLCVRRGSVALILATLIPSSGGEIMWLNMPTLTTYALGLTPPRISPEHRASFLFLFSACAWTIVFTGWLGWWASSRASSPAHAPSRAVVGCARALFVLAWLSPCLSLILYAWRYERFDLRYVLIAVLLHLWIGARLRSAARRNPGTHDSVFWLMLLPVSVALFGWVCIAIILFFSPGPIFAHGILLGGGGAAAMLVGWVRWWRVSIGHA